MCKNYWSKMYQDFATHTLTHSNKDNNDKIKTVRNCKNIFWPTVESCVDDWNIQHSQNNLSHHHHVLLFNIICLLLIRDNSWKRECVLTKSYFCLSSGESRTKNISGYFGHLMDKGKTVKIFKCNDNFGPKQKLISSSLNNTTNACDTCWDVDLLSVRGCL